MALTPSTMLSLGTVAPEFHSPDTDRRMVEFADTLSVRCGRGDGSCLERLHRFCVLLLHGPGRWMIGAQEHLSLTGGLTVMAFGLEQIALVTVDVGLIRQRHDVVRVIAAERALDAVGIGVGEMFGIGKLSEVSQHSAQQVDGPERVGVLGLEHAAAVVDVLPEHGRGQLVLAEMP